MAMDLRIRIGFSGTLREKVLAAMAQIRPALAGEVKGLLIDVANRTTRRASGDVLRVRTGHLRRSIGPPTVQETGGGVEGSLKVTAHYAPFLEHGTRPYRIVPRRAKTLRFLDRSGTLRFARSVQHPGLRPRPFFEPSWDEVMGGAKARLSAVIQRTLNEA